jgi:hypothetical protein
MRVTLNFLWINAVKIPAPYEGGHALNQLPENFYTSPSRLPHTPIQLWVDLQGAGKNQPFVAQTLEQDIGHPNVHVRLLDEIPAYTNTQLFSRAASPQDDHNDTPNADELDAYEQTFWQQIDLAKLLVLQQALDEGAEAAIFADMDLVLTDEEEKFEAAQKILKSQGVVVGMMQGLMGLSGIENQFAGFAAHARALLDCELVPRTVEAIELMEDNGFDTFQDVFSDQELRHYGLTRQEIGLVIHQLEDFTTPPVYPARAGAQYPPPRP